MTAVRIYWSDWSRVFHLVSTCHKHIGEHEHASLAVLALAELRAMGMTLCQDCEAASARRETA